MNPSILEQTQRIRQEATQRFNKSYNNTVSNDVNIQKPSELKPELRGLTKEETALMIGGGVLALGLGVVVVANMDYEDAVLHSTPIVAKIEPLPKPVISKQESIIPHSEPVIYHTPTHIPHSIHVKVPDEVMEASNVSDNQTFKEAFDTARHELGPGHIFEWNGTVYNTFTANELHVMTNEQHQQWGEHYTDFVENHLPTEPLYPSDDNHVAINTFDHFSWTGIDKNGDGILEVLIAKEEGYSPVVWADTDNDGKIDTRFDYDATTGNLMSSDMPPEAYNTDLINDLPVLDHLQIPELSQIYSGNYSLQIEEYEQNFKISIASNDEHTIDIIAIHEEGKDPFLILDTDGDGHLETLYGYDHNVNHVESLALEQPIDPILFNQEIDSDGGGEHPLTINPPGCNPQDYIHYTNTNESNQTDHLGQESYFNNHDDVVAHDFDAP